MILVWAAIYVFKTILAIQALQIQSSQDCVARISQEVSLFLKMRKTMESFVVDFAKKKSAAGLYWV